MPVCRFFPELKAGLRISDDAKKVAAEIGYPVIVKASAGGGGIGMQIVNDEKALEDAITASMRIAQSAFGDATVFIEKYLVKPRHIEFQILADEHGNAVHLYERECSIQRRHQKLIEEAPCSDHDPGTARADGAVGTARWQKHRIIPMPGRLSSCTARGTIISWR